MPAAPMNDLPTFVVLKILTYPTLHSSDKVAMSEVCNRWHTLLQKRSKWHAQMATEKQKTIWYKIRPWQNFEDSIANNPYTPKEILLNSVGNKYKAEMERIDILDVKLDIYQLYRAPLPVIAFTITYCNGKGDIPFSSYFVPRLIYEQLVPVWSNKVILYPSGPVVPITNPSRTKKSKNVTVYYCYQFVIGKQKP